MITELKKSITQNIKVHKSLLFLRKDIESTISKIFLAIKKGNKILICGNGGSAADAQHLAAEFLVRLKPSINRKAFPVITLAQDTSTITACGNDLGFSNIFSRNLSALGKDGDVLIVLSTSGNSQNIIKVLKQAKKQKIFTIAFLGCKGGKAKDLSHLKLIINSNDTARIQEAHIFLGHFIFSKVEELLLK